MKIGVCISTVKESETIGALVRALYAKGLYTFVVDGSGLGDDTWLKANNAGAHVRVLEQPLGIAVHLLTAWRMALDADCDLIVQMDAGGSHDPKDIHKLIQSAEQHAMVIGSRFCKGAKYVGNPKRALMSRIAAQLCNLKQGTHFTDWTSGYRAFTRDAALALIPQTYNARMHAFQIEVLNYAVRLGLDIKEVPITYTAGRSSFNRDVAKEAWRVYRGLEF